MDYAHILINYSYDPIAKRPHPALDVVKVGRHVQRLLGHRLEGSSSASLVGILTPEHTKADILSYIHRHDQFGFKDDDIFVFDEGRDRKEHNRTGIGAGTFNAVPQMFETGMVHRMLDQKVQYILFSHVDNLNATFRPDMASELTSSGCAVLAEIVPRKMDGYPIAVVVDDNMRVFEEGELSKGLLTKLEASDAMKGTATGTYIATRDALCAVIGMRANEFSLPHGEGYFRGKFAKSVTSFATLDARRILSTPISHLTHSLDTTFSIVKYDRFMKYSDLAIHEPISLLRRFLRYLGR